MAGRIQKGAVSQPKTFGAAVERSKIISDNKTNTAEDENVLGKAPTQLRCVTMMTSKKPRPMTTHTASAMPNKNSARRNIQPIETALRLAGRSRLRAACRIAGSNSSVEGYGQIELWRTETVWPVLKCAKN